MKKNVFNLKFFTDKYKPHFLFLSEHQIFQSDLPAITKYFKGEYSIALNSEDLHDPDLVLTSSKAKGGTAVMWMKSLDPYITVYNADCSSFLPIIVDIPGWKPMVHVSVYLPTAGKDTEFYEDLTNMGIAVEGLLERYPSAALFIRGDSNSNKKNLKRSSAFNDFCLELDLSRVPLNHSSYHHFLGNGSFDSEIDVLLYTKKDNVYEQLLQIVCQLDDCQVDSHHDVLLSSFCIPPVLVPPEKNGKNISAPKIVNARHKIIWSESEDALKEYETLVSLHLPRIRQTWLNTDSLISMSVLLQCTNMVLTQSAMLLNKFVSLSSPPTSKSAKIPSIIRRSNNSVVRISKLLKVQLRNPNYSGIVVENTRAKYKALRAKHQRIVRRQRMLENTNRDTKMFSILGSKPSDFFNAVRRSKKSANVQVHKLHVDGKVYEGDTVGDGFYDNIEHLKTQEHSSLSSSPNFLSAELEYKNILRICQEKMTIPLISLDKTRKILQSIRPAVMDHSSITGYHYRHSGVQGLLHLQHLVNAFISDVSNMSLEELNTTWACILHKGHGKDKYKAENYRTISCCPFLSKVIDTYLCDMFSHIWHEEQALSQFQGPGSNHELAALLLTECVQVSLNSLKKPIFILYLDAKSAFDLVLRQVLIPKLYHYGIQDQGLLMFDNRLKHRKTVCEWRTHLMGPISDLWGLEQGGKNSSDLYKVYNNDQLKAAQDSQLGVDLGGDVPLTISAIGQADDVALVSNDIFSLQNLLHLSLKYCERHHVTLRAEKTKLQVFSNKQTELASYYAKVVSPLTMGDTYLSFVEDAEHVGILRSTGGNMPHILKRIASHKKALHAVLPLGLARGHRGNPAAVLQIHCVYALPVLLSGLSSLVLRSDETNLITRYTREVIERLQKLQRRTPLCIVMFLGGQLPGLAQLHLRQLTLFGMISRDPKSLLYRHACHVLAVYKASVSSWFQHLRDICLLYELPHPQYILQHPPTKGIFERLVKSHVIRYWETKLRQEAKNLTSAPYFVPEFMSLTKPHPIWSSCGSNPFEVHKAVITARMLSGRYPTDQLQRHWTQNKAGICLLPTCASSKSLGSLEHLLLMCPALAPTRLKLLELAEKVSTNDSAVSSLLLTVIKSGQSQAIMQIILDCSTTPDIISHTQKYGSSVRDKILYFGRTWCYSIHRERMIQMGLLNFR